MSVRSVFFDCEKCGFTTSQTSYEVNDETWCNDCYTKEYYPDVWAEEQSKKAFLERCEKPDCNCCSHPENDDEELVEVPCGHMFCPSCFEDIEKFNKCVECFEVIDDDAEPNKETCGSCYREMCDCICYYNRPINDNKDEIFYYALFMKFRENVNHRVIRKLIEMFDSNYGYKDFDYDNQKLEDIEILEEYGRCYVFQVLNLKYNPNKDEVANNQKYTRVRLEFHTEYQLDEMVNEYVKENIQYFNRICIFNNIKDGVYKEVIEPDEEEVEEPEKVFENENCPVCLECYDEDTIIKRVACCGHMTCQGCYNHIIHSNNSRCPECREVWDDVVNQETEYIEWDMDDIEELCDNEENETLNEIVNIEGLCEEVVATDGYAHTLGYDECEYYGVSNKKFRGEENLNMYVLVGDY